MGRGGWLLTIAGLMVFLVVLVLYLPASWMAAALPPQVHCEDIGGSVWEGECLGLAVQGQKLGDATWNLSAGSAFTGRLVGDVDLRGESLNARANVDTNFKGDGELSSVVARFPLDPAFISQLPVNQRGEVTLDLKRVAISAGRTLRAADGVIELHDFRQTAPRPLALGSYQLRFAGVAQADGTLVGQLRDLGGPFAVEGTVALTPPANYLVNGNIAGRGSDAESLVREITLGAPPDPSGKRPFSLEGSY